MQLTRPPVFLLLAAVVSAASVHHARQQCTEAARFGEVSITPNNVVPGDIMKIKADFTCSLISSGSIPTFTDYYIKVLVNNNGQELPILLTRRRPVITVLLRIDEFVVRIPFAPFDAAANYSVVLDNTFAINGTNGSPVSVVGSFNTPITINLN